MAGGVGPRRGVWAAWDDKNWLWQFGEPADKIQGVTYAQMWLSPRLDQYEVVTPEGHKLVVTAQGVVENTDVLGRLKPLPGPHKDDDKPFVGFDNLPEPEFGTGWDDFDWSK